MCTWMQKDAAFSCIRKFLFNNNHHPAGGGKSGLGLTAA